LVESSYQLAAIIFQQEIARGEPENGRGKLVDARDQLEKCSDQLSDAIFRFAAFGGFSSRGRRRPSRERDQFAERGRGIVAITASMFFDRVNISPSCCERLSELVLDANSTVQ
jgi:hypothetical protein